MEHHVVVEALLREIHEVLDGLGCVGREQVDLDVALLRGDRGAGHRHSSCESNRHGVETVTLSIAIGLVGSCASAAAAIASTASIPEVTYPMIWYVLADSSAARAASSRTTKNWEPTEFGAGVLAIATVPRLYVVVTGSSWIS